MKGVEIIDMEFLKEDKRGSFYEILNRNAEKMLLIQGKKGSVFGDHYHTDENPWKNPEMVLLLNGVIEFHFKNVNTGEEMKRRFDKPTLFKADPYIYHAIKALTDIVLIDMNSIADDKLGRVKGDKLV